MQPRCVTAGWPAASSSWRCRGLLTPPTAAVGAAPSDAPANSGGCPVPTQPRRALASDAGACCAASSAEHAGRCAGKARNRHGGPRWKRSPVRLAKASGAARAAGRLSVLCLRTEDAPKANKCAPYAFPIMTSCRAGEAWNSVWWALRAAASWPSVSSAGPRASSGLQISAPGYLLRSGVHAEYAPGRSSAACRV